MPLTLRPARPDDAAVIHAFVCELADYEKLRHEVEATEADFARELFGPQPRVFCDIAEWEGAPAGFALYYYTFSTFRGRQGLFLEDIYVRPAFRGRGIARALMRRLARRCLDEGLGRFEWNVLDWNEPAIRFYRSVGAVPLDAWTMQRVTGEALERLAQG